MKRRALLTSSVAFLAAAPPAAAQYGGRLPHVVYLVPGNTACAMTPAGEAFQQALSDFGYVPGRDIRWNRQCYQTEDRLPDMVAELVRTNPDIIFVTGTRAALAAKRATTTIPIVFAGVADPVASGLIVGLANPTGNITGESNAHRDLNHKIFQLLKEAIPGHQSRRTFV
jgi:putative tryptophan/tyrosine transport system substrate-binding protein